MNVPKIFLVCVFRPKMEAKIGQQKLMYLVQNLYQIHQLMLTHFSLHFRSGEYAVNFVFSYSKIFNGFNYWFI